MGEESLDVDMLMAGCPSCKIIVMEGSDHASAIATAAKLGAVSMNMSWGYGASQSDCSQVWVPPAGLTLFGASGDQGYTSSPGAPAACASVVAVGWTQLTTDSSARGYADTIPSGWGSAGGCDGTITKASWQADPSCSTRMISDVSANGDNVAAYCTSPTSSANWHVTGGSSAASPFTSGVLATLGVTGGTFTPAWLYANAAKFVDVTSGGPVQNCPSGSPTYFCNPVVGYDGPTGVGTPYGPLLASLGTDGGAGCVLPGGSYSQSCAGCAAESTGSGCTLTCATCAKIDGTENPDPSLPLPCNGAVVNDDGALQCIEAASGDGGSSSDAGLTLDATVLPPPTLGGTGDDASAGAGAGPGDAPGSGTSGSTGCGCTEARSVPSQTSALLAGGLALAWGARRRRRATPKLRS